MKKFLAEVAENLYRTYGTGISDLHIIFPGKRARLFFNDALLGLTEGRPMWQPRYLSMDDLIRSLSPLEGGDHLRLTAELYRIYNEYHPEPFDRFFRWGEMLLSDFDTIDKYLIDAETLYANISDLHDIEDRFGGLFAGNDEAMELVRGFWTTLNRRGVQSAEQQQFLKIWRSLHTIYTAYKNRLRTLGIGYSGMIYRDMAESLDLSAESDKRFDGKIFCFVGFNALNECEKRLFDYLKETGAGRFYWDYDNYFYRSDDQEAGRFIRRNTARFGDDAPDLERDHFVQPKQIEVISTPSDILQCKALYRKLEEIHDEQGFLDKETAIVLTDENLLLPVLHSIPPAVRNLNVTMGYPLANTVPYILLERLLMLQSHAREGRFSYTDVLGILSHPYVAEQAAEAAKAAAEHIDTWQTVWVPPDLFAGNDLLRRIFRPVKDVDDMQRYIEEILSGLGAIPSDTVEARERKEFLFTLLENVLRLGNTVRECDIELSLGIYISLVRQTLVQCRVPYEGEPLSGLQVMGILETRNLDFDNVILLSLTDDTFPGNRDGNSYVPFNLRQAFGLPTPQDHEAMYAYYFYRLIARCRRLILMYSSAADDNRTGEQSRYIYQLEYEAPHEVERASVDLRIDYRPVEPILVPKTPEIMRQMQQMRFYPSTLNRYIDCPLKFYFADVERLEAPEQLGQEVTHLDVGNTLHRALELLCTPLVGKPDAARHIAAFTSSDMQIVTEQAMADVMGARGQDIEISGRIQMHRDIVIRYLQNILHHDSQSHAEPFRISGLEKEVKHTFGLGGRCVTLAGKADRIDLLGDGTLRIVDYKSGGDTPEFASIESLFTNEKVTRDGELRYEPHNGGVLQTLLYALVLGAEERVEVSPALYVARKMRMDDYSPYPVCKEEGMAPLKRLRPEQSAALVHGLEELFAAMFDASQPFGQTEHVQKCAVCDFRSICRR
ncbi:PD-(D/E)XK nuclease family protein [uncultured Rikenella sp.]|uniref:PD-(D/E)XK nuclease family protein n=1 Tax=uncultured Rikenella sp. TaxID=368003 RepID=UPI0026297E8A|nr:PD-(D/E)XK nuclease family protein [uncultured Rikenella sp.]